MCSHLKNDLLQALHPIDPSKRVHPRNVQHREHGGDGRDGSKTGVKNVCPEARLIGGKVDRKRHTRERRKGAERGGRALFRLPLLFRH